MEYSYQITLIYFNNQIGMQFEKEMSFNQEEIDEILDAILDKLNEKEKLHLMGILAIDEDGVQSWFFTRGGW